MGLLTRLADLSKAAINEALDKLEQPDMMMKHYLRSMQEEIEALQSAVAREESEALRLTRMIEYYNSSAEDHERKAAEAVAEGRMAEARQAVEAKLSYLDQAAECAQALEASKLRLPELTHQLNQVKSEYANLQAKRDDLAKRAEKLQTEVLQPAYNVDIKSGSAARGFQRIEEAILQREMEIELKKSEKLAAAAAREALIEEQLSQLKNKS